jgi:hypothetical protein
MEEHDLSPLGIFVGAADARMPMASKRVAMMLKPKKEALTISTTGLRKRILKDG